MRRNIYYDIEYVLDTLTRMVEEEGGEQKLEETSFRRTASPAGPPPRPAGGGLTSVEKLARYEAVRITPRERTFEGFMEAIRSAPVEGEGIGEIDLTRLDDEVSHTGRSVSGSEAPPPEEHGEKPTQQFAIGERVRVDHLRREGLVVDYSAVTRQYAVRFETGEISWYAEDSLSRVGEDTVEEEDTSPSTEENTITLHDLLFGPSGDRGEQTDPEKVMLEILKDPNVAPVVVKKLMEQGIITPEKALQLLAISGSVKLPKRRSEDAEAE